MDRCKRLVKHFRKLFDKGKKGVYRWPMTFAQLQRRYGKTDSEIAAALAVSRQLVAYWRKHGLSEARQAWLREKTNGVQ